MTGGAYRLDHVAIAVSDLQRALALYRDVLGMPVGGVERVEDQSVDVAFVGEEPGRIELICPFRESGVSKFIAKRGEGLHHVAVRVHDVAAALAALKARGVALIDEAPRKGAHGSRWRSLHPRGERRVLTGAAAGRRHLSRLAFVQPGSPV